MLLATRESRRRSSSDTQLRNEKARLIKSHFAARISKTQSFFLRFRRSVSHSDLPVYPVISRVEKFAREMLVALSFVNWCSPRFHDAGARYRVRTCDPYRVKVVLYH